MKSISPSLQSFLQSFFWAVFAWTLMQLPPVQKSWLGAPDKQGLNTILQLQRNHTPGEAAPLMFIDFAQEDWAAAAARRAPETPSAEPGAATTPVQDAAVPARSVPLYVPRQALADTLDVLRGTQAHAVFVDVDMSALPMPEDDRVLAAAIDRWRAAPAAPLLVLARTEWSLTSILERNGFAPLAPSDPVVEAVVRVWSSSENTVDSIDYWSCEATADARTPQAHAAVYLAAAARLGDPLKAKAAVADALRRIDCTSNQNRFAIETGRGPLRFPDQNGPIYFHLSMEQKVSATAREVEWINGDWGAAPLRKADAARCESTGEESSATRIRVIDLLDAFSQPGATIAPFCSRTIVVGASAAIARDTVSTLYGPMPGAFVIGNAARGLDLVGPLKRSPFLPGLGFVLAVTFVVFFAYRLISSAAKRLLRRPSRGVFGGILRFVIDNATHPLTLSVLIGNFLFLVGLAVSYFTIQEGYWGLFGASALAASLSNAFDEVSDMREALLRKDETGDAA